MRAFIPLFRRQLTSYFCSPGTYVLFACFLALSGLGFSSMMYRSLVEPLEPADVLFGSALFRLAVLGVVTLTTMGLIADERSSGAMETLLTAPVTDVEVVMAKHLGAVSLFTALFATAVLGAVTVVFFNAEDGAIALLPLSMGFIMLVLIASFYASYGLFVSSLVRSRVVAGALCFAGICFFLFFEELYPFLPGMGALSVAGSVPSMRPVLEFARGVVDTRPAVFYVSGSVFFLFATVKVIEARLWK